MSNTTQTTPIKQEKTIDLQPSLKWIIELEKLCPLPNKAKIEIITKEYAFSVYKINSELKFLTKPCEECDITIIVDEYPKSINEGREFISQGKIKINLNRSILSLLSKGYGSTYYCLQKL
jgi:hypothetical protein